MHLLVRVLALAAFLVQARSTGASRGNGSVQRGMAAHELVAATRSSRPRAGKLDPAFDCAWREFALTYALELQPWMSTAQLAAIVDSLQVVVLNCSAAVAAAESSLRTHVPAPRPVSAPAAPSLSIYVDYAHGSDSAAGTEAEPLKTIAAAVALSRVQRGAAGGGVIAIVLRAGTHVLAATVALTPADSLLAFVAYPAETPVVTGALPLQALSWTPYNISNGSAPVWGAVLPDHNAVSGQCPGPDVPDKGIMANWSACQQSCQADKTCTAWTFHTVNCTGCTGWINHCCWRTDGEFAPVPQVGVFSQGLAGGLPKNIWVADLPALPAGAPPTMTALRINGHRATLARFPNANPELDLFPKGYIGAAKAWLPPVPGPVWNETFTVDLSTLGLADGGRGVYINYTVGIGGNADRYDPPRAYWASADFGPRSPEQPTATCNRWQEMHLRSPSGIDAGDALVHAPYADASQMVVRTWRDGHWYSWMFGCEPLAAAPGQYAFVSGGHQGGEGCDAAAEFWVQGLLEELDAPNEYFYDGAAGKLYFFPNASDAHAADGSPAVALAEVPALAVLFSAFGSEEFPVRNITFSGLTMTGGRPTFMDPHGQPAGGDWALERLGAVLLEGTEDALIADCNFTRIDGNAVFLSGYNRRAAVMRNDFSLLGNSAVASWGRTDDWDGTGSQQPRHSVIAGNICHDIGIEQKQSSFYFQAQSCENTLTANIVYNIPRAAVNFEDGFGGANTLVDNLLYNTCRESSDHGAFNRSVSPPARLHVNPLSCLAPHRLTRESLRPKPSAPNPASSTAAGTACPS